MMVHRKRGTLIRFDQRSSFILGIILTTFFTFETQRIDTLNSNIYILSIYILRAYTSSACLPISIHLASYIFQLQAKHLCSRTSHIHRSILIIIDM